MRRQCAWCKCHLGPILEGTTVTHGICNPCAEEVLTEKVPADSPAETRRALAHAAVNYRQRGHQSLQGTHDEHRHNDHRMEFSARA